MQEVERDLSAQVSSIINLADIEGYLRQKDDEATLVAIEAYRTQYGSKLVD